MLSRRTAPPRLDSLHHSMHPGLLRNNLTPRSFRDSLRVIRAPPIPYTSHIISENDLDEPASLDVPNLDESAIEKEDVGRVPGNSLCCSFPLDHSYATAWVSMIVDVQSEFYGSY